LAEEKRITEEKAAVEAKKKEATDKIAFAANQEAEKRA
jgi:hypothetical protein